MLLRLEALVGMAELLPQVAKRLLVERKLREWGILILAPYMGHKL